MRISGVIGGLVVSACVARADFGGNLAERMRDGERMDMAAAARTNELIIAGMVCGTLIVCALLIRRKRRRDGAT